MEVVRGLLLAEVAWIMLIVTAPILGAILGRYLGEQFLGSPSAAYRGAVGSLLGYLFGVGIAIFAIFQALDHGMEILGILFPHIR